MANRYRPTVVEIDLGALRQNFQFAKSSLPRGAEILAVVKANAYGHGDLEISKTLIEEGVHQIGVAILEEAVGLRAGGIQTPIIILTGIDQPEFKDVVQYQATPVLWNRDIIKTFHDYLKRNDLTSPVFIKVDTGMHRLGVTFDQFSNLCRLLKGLSRFHLKCLMTHLAISEEPENALTKQQLKLFEEAIGVAKEYGLEFERFGVGNSGAILNRLFTEMEASKLLVRPGIMLYGSTPSPRLPGMEQLKPVMHFKTAIHDIKKVKKGESIGYGATFKATEDMRMGVLPVGYADGYHRHFSNRAEVLVQGKRARVVGNVSMDLTTIDLSNIPEARVGDEVILLGSQGKETISAWDLANIMGTIPYEIFCGVSPRVPRIYRD
ncbi:MAG TPA: alanine racemase [Bdellovibrionota bacterium]|nr:alanine racemase [Bdellovibrionota bacterium]